ncbi:MAG: helix-turn-helix domain-containing protein [Acidimicrobiales bacterium]
MVRTSAVRRRGESRVRQAGVCCPPTWSMSCPLSDARRFLETSERHVRRLVAERRIPYLKVGGRLRFDDEEVACWLDTARRERRQAPVPLRPRSFG